MQKTFTFEFEATKRPGRITSGRGTTPTVWAGLSHRTGVQSRFPSHTLTWPTHTGSPVSAYLIKAQDELAKAKREAGRTDSKDRLSAELNGPCLAYMGAGKEVAAGR